MKVVIDSAIPFIKGVLEPFAQVVYLEGDAIGSADVADADALVIRTRTRCNRELLEGSKVKIIATATIGFDHIDMGYCRRAGIIVSTADGCNARGVLQWVSGVLVALARKENFEPSERTLGIVGVGNVGRLVKQYAESWGFKVVCCDPPREHREHLGFVELEELLSVSDIVTLHTPLDKATRGMINRASLKHLRCGATLINASRGEVAESHSLLRDDLTLAVDVWEGEPNIDCRVLDKAFVATPHIAGYSLQGKANATALSVSALASFFGWPLIGWYPEQVARVEPQPISWQRVVETIDNYCDVLEQSKALKNGEDFERLRNNYNYRPEYF